VTRPFVSIVVANWEGAEWIARCVSSLQLSARAAGRPCEIIVVDDASSDGSADLVRERFPAVRLLVNARNRGYGFTTMRGARAARGRVLVLCNNDLAAQEDFIPRLTGWFARPRTRLDDGTVIRRAELFSVSAKTLTWWDGVPNQLRQMARWRGARLTGWSMDSAVPIPCLYTQAGAAAYDRRKFFALGGLCDVFAPGYWEDYELAYRARKAGYTNLFEPRAIALHHGGGSMRKRFGDDGVNRMKARNHLLFEWTVLSDPSLLIRHVLRLPVEVLRENIRGREPRISRALAAALPLMPRILARRASAPRAVADRTLLSDPD